MQQLGQGAGLRAGVIDFEVRAADGPCRWLAFDIEAVLLLVVVERAIHEEALWAQP